MTRLPSTEHGHVHSPQIPGSVTTLMTRVHPLSLSESDSSGCFSGVSAGTRDFSASAFPPLICMPPPAVPKELGGPFGDAAALMHDGTGGPSADGDGGGAVAIPPAIPPDGTSFFPTTAEGTFNRLAGLIKASFATIVDGATDRSER